MNFLERNGANLRPGNLVFTMILLTGVLGMCAYLYTVFLGIQEHNPFVRLDANNDFVGKNYEVLASLVSVIVTTGVCLGIMIGKANNDFMGGSKAFETVALFILTLIFVVVLCLDFLPRAGNSAQNGHDEINYEAVLLPVASIVLGMITVMSGMNREYRILGTSLFLLMAIVTLALTVYIYTVATKDDNIDAADTEKLYKGFDRK